MQVSTPEPVPAHSPRLSNGSTTPQNGDANTSSALKKAWLNSLPHEQLIQIVFKLEELIPPTIDCDIWPKDIKATLAEGKEQDRDTDDRSIAAKATTTQPSTTSDGTTVAPHASTVVATASTLSQGTVIQALTPTPTPTPSQIPVPPLVAPSHPPLPAYPHAPYYPGTAYYAPGTTTAVSHASQINPYAVTHYPYPGFPTPYQSPQVQTLPPPPTTSTSSSPFTSAPLVRIPKPSDHAPTDPQIDDLPSYEEMIVTTLVTSMPNGLMPKEIFSVMAMQYPLQANFRPSASQALQKAFKRGRLEKSSDGRYRLNASWGGGATTRRTTRRPQTQMQQQHPYPWTYPHNASDVPQDAHSASPHANHHASSSQASKTITPSAGITSSSTNGTHPSLDGTTAPTDTDSAAANAAAVEAWEAAHNILKALNIGSLLMDSQTPDAQVASSFSGGDKPPDEPARAPVAPIPPMHMPPVIAQDVNPLMSFLQQSSTQVHTSAPTSSSASLLALPTSQGVASVSVASGSGSTLTPAHLAAPVAAAVFPTTALSMPLHELKNPDQLRPREELRKCLATLAAQLADIAGAGNVGGDASVGSNALSGLANGVRVDVT